MRANQTEYLFSVNTRTPPTMTVNSGEECGAVAASRRRRPRDVRGRERASDHAPVWIEPLADATCESLPPARARRLRKD